ncbi:MAG TPA: response regulator transcription factor [Burkholderiales bacterium]|nr:response regulator transcription factor [Burkholderiales bacterium]
MNTAAARDEITVFLVDDHSVVREGYRRLLERSSGIRVIGEAASAADAYSEYQRLNPDVVVMDISLPGASGIEAMRHMLARDARAKVLMFSMHEETIFATRAFQAGALGYVTKASAPEVLVEAVRSVAQGKRYLSQDMAQALALQSIAGIGGDAASLHALSNREFEVMRLLVAGDTIAAIAEKLQLSTKTVANHQSAIRQKLRVETSAQLVQVAQRNGVLPA